LHNRHRWQLRILRAGRDAMIAPRLCRERRNRAEAMLAEPDSRARRARRRSAQTEQLQHGLAPRHAFCLFRFPFGFFGHGGSPGQISIM
jgi:hypothetical protein